VESRRIIYDQAYTDRQHKKSFLRKTLRSWIWLSQTLSYVVGPTIDFGCGTGELLAKLPKGSIGLDINKATVAYCQSIGLDVRLYDPIADNYTFNTLERAKYKTCVMSHVLEHLEHPSEVLKRILSSCDTLGIQRIVLIVPGSKGFRSDPTHMTYVDDMYLRERSLYTVPPYRATEKRYFPFPFAWVGNHVKDNELQVVYDRD
jgi:SAM-dependent methyltransferase